MTWIKPFSYLYTEIDNIVKNTKAVLDINNVIPQHEIVQQIQEKPHIPATPTIVMVEDETPKQAVKPQVTKSSIQGKNVTIGVSDGVQSSDKS